MGLEKLIREYETEEVVQFFVKMEEDFRDYLDKIAYLMEKGIDTKDKAYVKELAEKYETVYLLLEAIENVLKDCQNVYKSLDTGKALINEYK